MIFWLKTRAHSIDSDLRVFEESGVLKPFAIIPRSPSNPLTGFERVGWLGQGILGVTKIGSIIYGHIAISLLREWLSCQPRWCGEANRRLTGRLNRLEALMTPSQLLVGSYGIRKVEFSRHRLTQLRTMHCSSTTGKYRNRRGKHG